MKISQQLKTNDLLDMACCASNHYERIENNFAIDRSHISKKLAIENYKLYKDKISNGDNVILKHWLLNGDLNDATFI